MDQFKEFLPFVVFAVIALLRVWNEFNKNKKKEQTITQSAPTKQSKTTWSSPSGQPSNKQTSSNPSQTVGPPPLKRSPFEVIMKEFIDMPQPRMEQPVEPKHKQEYREPKHQKPVIKVETGEVAPLKVRTTDLRNVEDMPEEVLRAKAVHEKHLHKFERFENYLEHEDSIDFDLRDAVIKSTILERYHY
ncbi:hypothetical protein [Solitalea lacus]|uniref:hypothetical protein n=1 Tax=Solitalea lacus TaxID=2911172 RepID=UPI001EDB3B3D|nr:hypothetical protein [Solitalea lacus]UKJ05883.1 hypothetical protein L2B55_10015 [Solitalea lacus]